MTELSFPGLGLQFRLDRVAFSIGGMPVYWYGIIMGLAFMAAAVYLIKRVRTFGLDGDRVIDVLLGTVVGGIIGARLYYVAFSWDTYQSDPIKIFSIREGGLAIPGGILFGALAALLMCRLRKVKFPPLADLFLSALLLAQAIGRWGNFVNIEAFGGNTTAPWGMTGPSIVNYLSYNQQKLAEIGMAVDPNLPVHPTFFYESVWCLLGFVVLALYTRRRRFDGELSLLYLVWYGVGRAYIEGLRTDALLAGTTRISQVLTLLCAVVAAGLLVYFHLKIRKAGEEQPTLLYVDTPEGQAVLAGTFYPKKGKEAEAETQQGEEAKEAEAQQGEEAKETEAQQGEEAKEAEAQQDKEAKEAEGDDQSADPEDGDPGSPEDATADPGEDADPDPTEDAGGEPAEAEAAPDGQEPPRDK